MKTLRVTPLPNIKARPLEYEDIGRNAPREEQPLEYEDIGRNIGDHHGETHA